MSPGSHNLSGPSFPLRRKNEDLQRKGHCFPVKFKRPKLDAVRDFPRGCGVLASPFNPKENITAVSSLGDQNFKGDLKTRCHSFPANFKRPKLDAVRHFPCGCGALAPQINKKEDKPVVVLEGNQILKAEEERKSTGPSIKVSQLPFCFVRPDYQPELQIPGLPNSYALPNLLTDELGKVFPTGLTPRDAPADYKFSAAGEFNEGYNSFDHALLCSGAEHSISGEQVSNKDAANTDRCVEGKSSNTGYVVESEIPEEVGDQMSPQSVTNLMCRRNSPLIVLERQESSNRTSSRNPIWIDDVVLTDAKQPMSLCSITKETSDEEHSVEAKVVEDGRKLHGLSLFSDMSIGKSIEDPILIGDNVLTDFEDSIMDMHCISKKMTMDRAGPEVEFKVVRGFGSSGMLRSVSDFSNGNESESCEDSPEGVIEFRVAHGNAAESNLEPVNGGILWPVNQLADLSCDEVKIPDDARVEKSSNFVFDWIECPADQSLELNCIESEETLDFCSLDSASSKELVAVVPPLDQSADCSRHKVCETLNLYRETWMKLAGQQQKENMATSLQALYMEAAMILKNLGKWVNTSTKCLGFVPGVEVGDRFYLRMELVIIGLHCQHIKGIDTMRKDGQVVATSIVDSGRYANSRVSSGVLIYSGQGGNPAVSDKHLEDQKLEGGNLALRNSMLAQTPVRVIRSFRIPRTKTPYDWRSKSKNSKVYVYDGLYYVKHFWQERGKFGKLVFMFELRKMDGQKVITNGYETMRPKTNKSGSFKARQRVRVLDISQGQEKDAIPAVNNLDDEKPPSFDYMTNITYPNSYRQPIGCNCVDGCSDPNRCSCASKNGGFFPFNEKGDILSANLPLVYECGPSCKCSSSCRNRVSQHGIRFPLEIFKTKLKGWGVRSRAYITSGSFICEYVGELISECEAQERCNDEYLFDIGTSRGGDGLKDELLLWPSIINSPQPLSEASREGGGGGGFTLDAAYKGNVGRFINHSCSPNLYAQNVLYDHEDKSMPHVMLFATKNIPPMQELTYDYNYIVDQVWDGEGNLKEKYCHCGSRECVGRLY